MKDLKPICEKDLNSTHTNEMENRRLIPNDSCAALNAVPVVPDATANYLHTIPVPVNSGHRHTSSRTSKPLDASRNHASSRSTRTSSVGSLADVFKVLNHVCILIPLSFSTNIFRLS